MNVEAFYSKKKLRCELVKRDQGREREKMYIEILHLTLSIIKFMSRITKVD